MIDKLGYQPRNREHSNEYWRYIDSCPYNIALATQLADSITDTDERAAFLASFGAQGLSDGEFFYFLADIAAGAV